MWYLSRKIVVGEVNDAQSLNQLQLWWDVTCEMVVRKIEVEIGYVLDLERNLTRQIVLAQIKGPKFLTVGYC
jgi:hypothetical protein